MDWDGNLISFVTPPPEPSSSLLYNYNFDHFSVLEMKKPAVETGESVVGGLADEEKKKKKKRLSKKQLESLERSFEEEVKVSPERKMKLSQELGLQPRQVAVWFQNRRARWKTKQLQHLCCTLKQDFHTISTQKHSLQQQVMKLRSMLREQEARNEQLMAYTNLTGEEKMINITREETTINVTEEETTMESMSEGINWSGSSDIYNVQDFNQISHSAPPLWWEAEQGRT